MGSLLIIICLSLGVSLLLTLFRDEKIAKWAVSFRILSISVCLAVFVYWFVKKSLDKFMPNATAIQLINELPQALDFYVIIPEKQEDKSVKYITEHLGNIRTDHYRLDYLNLEKANEYWVIGYLGKNVSYFTQHFVPNKNIDQTVNIKNYILEDENLIESAKKNIQDYQSRYMRVAFWITMCLLLCFLNIGTFIKIKSKH